jgi:hypothetical protein
MQRTPKPLPLASELEALRGFYTRVHWLVRGELDTLAAESEEALSPSNESPPPTGAIARLMRMALNHLYIRTAAYQSEYEYVITQTDDHSLQMIYLFIENARREYGKKPAFAFLFESESENKK